MSESKRKEQVAAQKRRKALEVRVVLDTNQLFTGSASDLLKHELAKLIGDSRRHADVRIAWYLPDIVKLERRYQMIEAAKELLPATVKLERLLGHGLAITPEILQDRVDAAITKQIESLNLVVLTVDHAQVDWARLVADSANRIAPFEPGKHEKGFRDSIVVETFVQLVNTSPRSSGACRIALVTGDELLASAVGSRTQAANVRVLRSLEELKDFINLVVSDVTEEFINRIRDAATALFFTKDDQSTLYYESGLQPSLTAAYAKELQALPDGATSRKNGTWFIGPSRFSHKKAQRVHWVTSIRVEAKANRQEAMPEASLPSSAQAPSSITLTPATPRWSLPSSISSLGSPTTLVTASIQARPLSDYVLKLTNTGLFAETRDILVASGQTVLEASWSVTVTATGKLLNPTVDDHRHVETTWDGSTN
ncbi:MAG TPA: hypothetical protein VGQ37_27875 [Vicinamibacterales bacterium]|jgi:hypothetical protein|nr:hypothetical protein [Vicinamibacterales bacterium]